MEVDRAIQQQVDLMYDTISQTLHTIDEKDMVVSVSVYCTVYHLITEKNHYSINTGKRY